MVGFVDFLKVIAKRSAFLAFPSAWSGVESEGVVENGGFKNQFSQVEGDLDLPKILNRFPFQKIEQQGRR
jgi:hypothetical protein